MLNAPAAPPAPAASMAISDTLSERVSSALSASPYTPGDRFRIEAADGAVRLHGQVATFFEKQMAQEVVRRLDGVQQVENLLEVSWA